MEALLEHPGIKLKNGGRVGGTKSEGGLRERQEAGSRNRLSAGCANSIRVHECQLANAGEQMKQIADEVVAASKDASRNQH